VLYLALARTSFARMFAYRGATVAGIVTNFFFGLLRAYVFIALFEAAGTDAIRTYTPGGCPHLHRAYPSPDRPHLHLGLVGGGPDGAQR